MQAVVFHALGDIRLDDVPEPRIEDPTDAIIRVTASAICGTDLHVVRGSMPGMKPGTILGHEAVGVVEEVGRKVRNLSRGDRVVVPSTIACGWCSYCRAGYHSQCDNANPNGSRAGTAFFGGPESSGSFDGLQAELARIPFANTGLVRLPDHVPDDQAILVSDIFPTGWFGADIAEIEPGDTVAVFGCGPVGQFVIASAHLMGAGRILAVDHVPSRLETARRQGAEVVNYDEEDPVEALTELTGGIGPDRVVDAVGVDARKPPGAAPSQALRWGVEALAKAGTLAVIGVYPPGFDAFPIGRAMNKNLTVNMGNCNHRRYIPELVDLMAVGVFDPTTILTRQEPLSDALEAYQAFDRHESGWLQVRLEPVAVTSSVTAQ